MPFVVTVSVTTETEDFSRVVRDLLDETCARIAAGEIGNYCGLISVTLGIKEED